MSELLCLCFKAKFRQAAQRFFGRNCSYQTSKFVCFSHACMQEEEHRTTKMEEGQKGNSGTWTIEDISAQQFVVVHTEMLDKTYT